MRGVLNVALATIAGFTVGTFARGLTAMHCLGGIFSVRLPTGDILRNEKTTAEDSASAVVTHSISTVRRC